ncbi:manganese-dependent ADP-ribose/CDP-alcohol diphosphatase-like [Lytechinus pictus]|uniref:manganese-dependent ADP-ribose/CDP-alcohol diphosphatase-like n=1 Tax=Lytechinus pictus TaxID=7653 RepID=UPI0030B9F787
MNKMGTAYHRQNMCNDLLFSFGAIADVQCGDLDDREIPTLPKRYYRGALSNLGDAVNFWNERCQRPSFVLQLGDVLDGFNVTRGGKDQSRQVLVNVLKECSGFKGEFHHAWGNHEFYNFTRLELLNSPLFSGKKYLEQCHLRAYKRSLCQETHLNLLGSDSSQRILQGGTVTNLVSPHGFTDETTPAYYDFSPFKGFRFVLLDTFEISTIGYSNVDCPEREAALKILKVHNKNQFLNDFSGLEGKDRRFCSYNGGISNRQLQWLKDVLCRAFNHREKVIVFGHVPIYPEVSLDDCLVWNYQDVLSILQSNQCVIATLFGHTHQYRHLTDETGIHHFVLPGVVECQPGSNDFLTFDMSAEGMVVNRAGEILPLTLEYRKMNKSMDPLHNI